MYYHQQLKFLTNHVCATNSLKVASKPKTESKFGFLFMMTKTASQAKKGQFLVNNKKPLTVTHPNVEFDVFIGNCLYVETHSGYRGD